MGVGDLIRRYESCCQSSFSHHLCYFLHIIFSLKTRVSCSLSSLNTFRDITNFQHFSNTSKLDVNEQCKNIWIYYHHVSVIIRTNSLKSSFPSPLMSASLNNSSASCELKGSPILVTTCFNSLKSIYPSPSRSNILNASFISAVWSTVSAVC